MSLLLTTSRLRATIISAEPRMASFARARFLVTLQSSRPPSIEHSLLQSPGPGADHSAVDVPTAESWASVFSAAEAAFPLGLDASTLSVIADSTPILGSASAIFGISWAGIFWMAHTTITLQAVKQSTTDLQAALALQATTQTARHQELKDQLRKMKDQLHAREMRMTSTLHASEMRMRSTLHTSLVSLHCTVSETKGEVSQLGKNQESCSKKVVSTTPPPYPPTTPRHSSPPSPPPYPPTTPRHSGEADGGDPPDE